MAPEWLKLALQETMPQGKIPLNFVTQRPPFGFKRTQIIQIIYITIIKFQNPIGLLGNNEKYSRQIRLEEAKIS